MWLLMYLRAATWLLFRPSAARQATVCSDQPSHILVPAIHRNRSGIRDIFQREMPDVDPALTDDPAVLAKAARRHLRRKFLSARARTHCPLPGCMNMCPVYERTATRTAGLPQLVSAGAGPSGPRRLAGRALRCWGRDPGW